MKSMERVGALEKSVVLAVDEFIERHSAHTPRLRARGKDYAHGGKANSYYPFVFRHVKGARHRSQRIRSNRRKAQR